MNRTAFRQLIREVITEDHREEFQDQLRRELRQANKKYDAERAVYYYQMLCNPNLTACASFDSFKGSAAYEQWKRKNEKLISAEEHKFHQFSYMKELDTARTTWLDEGDKWQQADLRNFMGDELYAWRIFAHKFAKGNRELEDCFLNAINCAGDNECSLNDIGRYSNDKVIVTVDIDNKRFKVEKLQHE